MIGIRGIEVHLPSKRMDLSRFSKGGVSSKPILGSGESIWPLAREAATALLKKSDCAAEKIDLIVFASCGVWDRYLWSPSAHVQNHLGANRAFSFDVLNGCNSGNLAVQLSLQWLKANAKQAALIVVADSLSSIVDYSNPEQACLYSFSDAATAILLQRGETRYQPIAFAASTNAAFANSMNLKWGQNTLWMNEDEEEDRALSREYRARYLAMIREALKNAELKISDVDHLFMNQGDHKLIQYLSEALPLNPERIFRSHEHFGHLGGSDIFFGMSQRMQANEIKPGEIIVLASSAIGYSWSATVIKA